MRALHFLFVALVSLALATAAYADDVPRLEGQITDLSRDGVLATGRARIQPVLDDLVRSDDIQLFVLFVETTGDRTVTDYTDEAARTNSLGGNDTLLVIALADRTDALWRSDSYLDRLTDRELELTDQLKGGLNKLKAKREELVQKRNELVSRAKMAKARVQVQRALKSVSIMDPTSDLSRFEERMRREEAMAKGLEEVAASSLEDQFAQLESDEDETEVEARFAELKAGAKKVELARV